MSAATGSLQISTADCHNEQGQGLLRPGEYAVNISNFQIVYFVVIC